jgi:hypothetical protein
MINNQNLGMEEYSLCHVPFFTHYSANASIMNLLHVNMNGHEWTASLQVI